KLRLERLEKRKAFDKTIKEAEKEEITEDKILEKVPIAERKREDLEEIISALENITGEKYEFSIDLDEEEIDEDEEKELEQYTNEDIAEFEKGFPKKAIWHGKPTIAFKEWLSKKYKS
ncbi:MAG: hypothetical protein ACFFB6_12375, partial [Promethearchaeota archaeon]